MKAEEVGRPARATIGEGFEQLRAAAGTLRDVFAAAARCSRSATAARPPMRWTSSPISPHLRRDRLASAPRDRPDGGRRDPDRDRQRHRRRGGLRPPGDRLRRSGDALLALSTSGDSRSVVAALVEARRRGLRTVALVGYDGGRVAAERLADHMVLTPSQHIPRIQEAQATAYHLLCDLVDRAIASRNRHDPGRAAARARAWRRAGRRLPALRLGLARRQGLTGFVLNDGGGVVIEVEGAAERLAAFVARAGVGGAVAGARRRRGDRADPGRRRPGVRDRGQRARRRAARRSPPTSRPATTACASCSTRPTGGTATRSSTAPSAARGSRSSATSRTTGRTRPWPASRCAPTAGASTRTRPTGGSTPSRSPAPSAGRADARALEDSRRRCCCVAAAILAVKGLGGYHLACDAASEEAVGMLRARKHRDDKPFA